MANDSLRVNCPFPVDYFVIFIASYDFFDFYDDRRNYRTWSCQSTNLFLKKTTLCRGHPNSQPEK